MPTPNPNPAISSDTIYRIKPLHDTQSTSETAQLSSLSSPTDVALAFLSTTSTLEDLHTSLLHSLSASGWTERVRAFALELLRSGRCTHFEDVVDSIVQSATAPRPPGDEGHTQSVLGKRKRAKETNGNAMKNGATNVKTENSSDAEGDNDDDGNEQGNAAGKDINGNAKMKQLNGKHKPDTTHVGTDELYTLPEVDVRIPPHIVGKGVKILHEALGEIIIDSVEDDDEDGEGELDETQKASSKAMAATKR
ncbi:hypothetical protein LOZ39_002450 [Ophidiomyces ophidiicola]|nr:hypothetical protein LOZ61_003240 [Ophidiomyces ophidiicola]KAI1918265.1 hypothetical protein LOZ64_002839 [Ophidiomyces ophidiicola]KAI1927537.1 hypothetical protein LOZ60_002992 [Ophidiomyces ophidiicola]KAI1959241.1 hypothetical protein LOZ59_003161 [Ophidiomyces ophidiicola]KAI2014866.1 hypothetical protein LOZ49_001093 [Ophidiomyces ophidiicola]